MQTTTEVYPYVLALPQKYRTVIHLYYYEGYRVAEIAKILGASENTVKSHLFRARDMLREQLKGNFRMFKEQYIRDNDKLKAKETLLMEIKEKNAREKIALTPKQKFVRYGAVFAAFLLVARVYLEPSMLTEEPTPLQRRRT